jgi:hypothetical protein
LEWRISIRADVYNDVETATTLDSRILDNRDPKPSRMVVGEKKGMGREWTMDHGGREIRGGGWRRK